MIKVQRQGREDRKDKDEEIFHHPFKEVLIDY